MIKNHLWNGMCNMPWVFDPWFLTAGRDANGFIVGVHPLGKGGLGIEKTKELLAERKIGTCETFNAMSGYSFEHGIYVSDGHRLADIGRAYILAQEMNFETPQIVAETLRSSITSGNFKGEGKSIRLGKLIYMFRIAESILGHKLHLLGWNILYRENLEEK